MAYNHPPFQQIRLQNLFDSMPMSDNQGFSDYSDPYSDPYGTSPEPWGFNQPTTETPAAPPPPSIMPPRTEPSINWMEEMERRFHPETAATERFNDLLNRFPQEGRPSLGRTIVASGMAAGQGGLENSQKFLHAPYLRDMAAWKEEAGPTYNAANLERQSNVNERQLLGSALTAEINQQKVNETLRTNQAKEDIARQKNDIARLIAMGWEEVDAPNSPTIILKQKNGTGVLDTKVSKGSMSQMELEAGRTARAMGVAQQQGLNQQNNPTNWVVVDGVLKMPDGKGGLVPVNQQGSPSGAAGVTPPTAPTAPTPAPTINRIGTAPAPPNTLEKGRIELDRMKDVYEVNQEAREWINNRNGILSMEPRPVVGPGSWFPPKRAVTQEMVDSWDRTKRMIDPTYVPPTSSVIPNQSIIPNQTQRPSQTLFPTNPNMSQIPANQNMTPIPGGGRGLGPRNIPTPQIGANGELTLPKGTPVGGDNLQQLAAEFLQQNGKPVTPANIEHAIRQGWVK